MLFCLALSAIALAGCTKTSSDKVTRVPVPELPEPAPNIDKETARKAAEEDTARRPGWKPFRQWGLRETTIDTLARIGKPAVPALVEALRDPNPDLRDQAALALARIGPQAEEAVPDLIAALNDDNEVVRKDVVRALGQVGPQAAVAIPELIDVLRSTEVKERAPQELERDRKPERAQRGAQNSTGDNSN